MKTYAVEILDLLDQNPKSTAVLFPVNDAEQNFCVVYTEEITVSEPVRYTVSAEQATYLMSCDVERLFFENGDYPEVWNQIKELAWAKIKPVK